MIGCARRGTPDETALDNPSPVEFGRVVREGCVTTVYFTPTGSGDRTATLYIMSQDGFSTWASVRLHGTARR
jgi:hypothetical protein